MAVVEPLQNQEALAGPEGRRFRLVEEVVGMVLVDHRNQESRAEAAVLADHRNRESRAEEAAVLADY